MMTKLQRSFDPVDQYVKEHSLRFTPEQNEIIEHTKTLPDYYLLFNHQKFHKFIFSANLPGQLGSLDEAQFFQVIIQSMGCKRCSKIFFHLNQ